MTAIRPVRKAVFPVAGLGTRFLPASKSVPKEMLTVVDMPVIQYAVNEAKAAGIEHFIFVTGRNKHVIEDHFDLQPELQNTLADRGKQDMLDVLATHQPEAGATSFTRQQAPLGLGHAVWCARDIVGDEPFALLLPDMVMKSRDGRECMESMMNVYRTSGGNVIGVQECHPDEVSSYGIVEQGETVAGGFRIDGMVEKPSKEDAPSNLYINGRYILQPEIFDLLENQERGAGGEIQLTDSMLRLADSQDFFGNIFTGETYDCGSKEGFIAANVSFALQRDDTGPAVREIIAKLMG
ncbi:UTP--glucose-1-phosphate uridylyltransferase [Ahrensia sp. R2A130]|uniref:UTP--glucose-1-phosphate uridylyltransferase n=1 Tax=Ahrensia sp. R2A130 TaxID=744979 RepID=UPI0001E0C371|nr:UTP--glucose-1-phosphate uridylyltransferase [Ahrensia sp. R2A130]EFL88787.1 UTP--glucose-1-phosphate uridylyltransferase [Ahrensia sp. R2A130]